MFGCATRTSSAASRLISSSSPRSCIWLYRALMATGRSRKLPRYTTPPAPAANGCWLSSPVAWSTKRSWSNSIMPKVRQPGRFSFMALSRRSTMLLATGIPSSSYSSSAPFSKGDPSSSTAGGVRLLPRKKRHEVTQNRATARTAATATSRPRQFAMEAALSVHSLNDPTGLASESSYRFLPDAQTIGSLRRACRRRVLPQVALGVCATLRLVDYDYDLQYDCNEQIYYLLFRAVLRLILQAGAKYLLCL
mmetsp:Transcript_14369/g.28663  ORF Transcript_14369/g.28663 Transcript_14369/m.28663 type:complete len:250 (-) Transcript_14369:71-820(-)